MDKWFEDLVKDTIWNAVKDALGDLDSWASKVEAELGKLKTGDTLSGSPLVAVVATEPGKSLTFLIRGRFNLFGGAVAPFVRIQVKVSVDNKLSPPLKIAGWDTVVGDLQIKKEDVFTAELAFGYDEGAWLGRGAFKIIPGGFGLDLLLGGIDERGLVVGIDVDLPNPIPLGSSGAVLTGVGGSFAYNFVPRLGSGVPKSSGAPWDVTDYVEWAKQDPDNPPDMGGCRKERWRASNGRGSARRLRRSGDSWLVAFTRTDRPCHPHTGPDLHPRWPGQASQRGLDQVGRQCRGRPEVQDCGARSRSRRLRTCERGVQVPRHWQRVGRRPV